jgi:uncharacterized membrane protein
LRRNAVPRERRGRAVKLPTRFAGAVFARSLTVMRVPLSLAILGTLFVFAGSMHFVSPEPYLTMMPPYLPWPLALVYISGVAEILGGVGVMIPVTRRAAGWGLIALLVAIFPANIHMALHPETTFAAGWSPWVGWLRLPLQAVMIYGVWRIAVRRTRTK